MNINKQANGDKMTIGLEGRLDTTTSPQLEEELKGALDGIKELEFDFSKLEYTLPLSSTPIYNLPPWALANPQIHLRYSSLHDDLYSMF